MGFGTPPVGLTVEHMSDTLFTTYYHYGYDTPIHPPLSKPATPQWTQVMTALDQYSILEIIEFTIGLVGIQAPKDLTFKVYVELYVDGVSQGTHAITLTYIKDSYNFFGSSVWGDFDSKSPHTIDVYFWTDSIDPDAVINSLALEGRIGTVSDTIKIVWEKTFDGSGVFVFSETQGIASEWAGDIYTDGTCMDDVTLLWSGYKLTFRGTKNEFTASPEGDLIYQRISTT